MSIEVTEMDGTTKHLPDQSNGAFESVKSKRYFLKGNSLYPELELDEITKDKIIDIIVQDIKAGGRIAKEIIRMEV